MQYRYEYDIVWMQYRMDTNHMDAKSYGCKSCGCDIDMNTIWIQHRYEYNIDMILI